MAVEIVEPASVLDDLIVCWCVRQCGLCFDQGWVARRNKGCRRADARHRAGFVAVHLSLNGSELFGGAVFHLVSSSHDVKKKKEFRFGRIRARTHRKVAPLTIMREVFRIQA